ncbi:hypothetical protein R3P38DRAFT_2774368 [Favolaschia claudopus]|uniref:Bacteriophage T5 Orf172 DNA-binding domain-containing protein n=1 Tax=Favolaschia claudopus TaxID=2862362 RepID=A0AAW0BYM4_9AGAR
MITIDVVVGDKAGVGGCFITSPHTVATALEAEAPTLHRPPRTEFSGIVQTSSGIQQVRNHKQARAPSVVHIVRRANMARRSKNGSKRTPSQERAFRQIRRLPPSEQKQALIEHKDNLPYLREGEGYIYLTAQLPGDVVQGQRRNEIEAELIVKWGETSRLTGRQEDYHKCEAGRVQMWIEAVHLGRRLLVERLIHLELSTRGYRRVIFVNPCGCGHRHREYVYLGRGSLADMESIMRGCLREAGEPDAQIEFKHFCSKTLRPRRRGAAYARR